MAIASFESVPRRVELLWAAVPLATAAGGNVLLTLLAAGVIGNYSTVSLAGVAIGGTIYVALGAPTTGIYAAHQIRSARLFGTNLQADAWKLTCRVARTGAVVLFAVAVVLAVTAGLLSPFLTGAAREAARYLEGRALSLPAAFVANVMANYLYVSGKRKAPLVLLAVNAAIIVPVGYLLIYGFKLGAFGDGVASTVATVIGVALVGYLAVRTAHAVQETSTSAGALKYAERFDEPFDARFMPLAAPLMISNTLDQMGTLALSLVIGFASVPAAAALRVGMNLQTVIFIAVNAVSVASVALFSSRVGISGIRKPRSARVFATSHIDGGVAAAVVCALIGGLFMAFGTHDPNVRAAMQVVIISALASIPGCVLTLYYVSRLRFEGRTKDDARANIYSVWLVLVPGAVILEFCLGGTWVFGSYVGYWIARAIFARYFYFRNMRTTSRSGGIRKWPVFGKFVPRTTNSPDA